MSDGYGSERADFLAELSALRAGGNPAQIAVGIIDRAEFDRLRLACEGSGVVVGPRDREDEFFLPAFWRPFVANDWGVRVWWAG